MGRQTIALAGVGNLGKYLCEELLRSSIYKGSQWLQDHEVEVYMSDYDKTSVRTILNTTNATALISFINCPGDVYFDIHKSLLEACKDSQTCKTFIPSEWIGNLLDFPHLPRFYGISHIPFRSLLSESTGVKWTLFNGGWLMDYFLTTDKTYMPAIPDEFPIDPNSWRACIRGSGDEEQAFTSARDIAKAVIELLGATHWEPVTYVVGEWNTFNNAVKIMEKFYDRPLEITFKTTDEIKRNVVKGLDDGELTREAEIAQVDEWMIAGATACPRELTLKQRQAYFSKVRFHTIGEFIESMEI
ncbi:hypothetical protein HYFRA_00002209 [Hymenoscyphus fraxineus]|uniref:NmrA-like domain-containing protein n=1 Tax=Hymenoscyphus fraxineus TaxID=746836 RepID=A0A9N9KN80_9HELO|nr:hypothetical protein HYFRA_00002209 [Hymenoscyphus fraxineus]